MGTVGLAEWPSVLAEQTAEVRNVGQGRTRRPPPPATPPPGRDLGAWLLTLLVLVLAGVAAAFVLTRDDNNESTTPAATARAPAPATPATPIRGRAAHARVLVTFPRLVGSTEAAALKRLKRQGLKPRVERVFSTKPRGIVADEKLVAGAQIAKGSVVVLTVSAGSRGTAVPEVRGQPAGESVALLRAAGFVTDVMGVQSSATRGTVVSQSPKSGAKAADGTVISLTISKGPATAAAGATHATKSTASAAAPATVPEVVGQDITEARKTIRAAGLVTESRYVPNSLPEGTVVAQSKKAGASAKHGEHMLVTVSHGRALTQQAAVPDVVGQDEATARSQLQSAGFTVATQDYATTDASQDGTVIGEQPGAGGKVPQGSQVLLYVGRLSG
jgi:beta-lactam-binding protein with PASTA domain